MLYFFYGNDTKKTREALQALVKSLLKKKPDAGYVRLDSENFTSDDILEHVSSQNLFTPRSIIVIDNVLSDDVGYKAIGTYAKDIANSENVFILLEEKPDEKIKKKLEKYAEKTKEFSLQIKDSKLKAGFNVFSLTDAFGKRDRRGLWVLYQKALKSGTTPEEIHGLLFWQLKTLLLVSSGDTSGIKPFVVGKAKRFLGNFTNEDLKNLSSRFVDTYHEARLGKHELTLGLEKLILEV